MVRVVGAGAGDDGRLAAQLLDHRRRRATTISSSLSVGDSPVVPHTTSPLEPLASRWRPSATAASSFTPPSAGTA